MLRLVKFVDLNIKLVERLLSLHDELFPTSQPIQSLYLSGNIGREAHTPADHHRLATLLYPDSLRATVGIAATVYYRYIKEQSRMLLMQKKKKDNGENSENGTTDPVMVQSMRAVPSMSSLASFLTTEEESDDEDDDGGVFGSTGGKDLRSLVLSERVLNLPVASAVQSLSNPEQAKLVGSVLLRIDTAMAKLTNTKHTMMEYLVLPDESILGRHDSFLGGGMSAYKHQDSTDDLKGLDEILEEHQQTVGTPPPDEHAKRQRRYSSYLNLANSFLYMVSYYLVAPTSSAYARRLGLHEAMSGTIIGATAVAALASTVLYSWWTSHSYKAALVFSSLCCLFGNLIYAAGLPFDSLTLVLVGRLLNGFGSARAINRRYIADAFSQAERTAASAHFVASGAAGMSVGPGLAAVMPLLIFDKDSSSTEPNLWWQEENAAGWVMAGLWVVYLAFLIPYFQDPPKSLSSTTPRSSSPSKQRTVQPSSSAYQNGTSTEMQSLFNGETTALLPSNNNIPEKTFPETTTTTSTPLRKRPAALITIYLVFLLKLVLELVLSAAAPVTGYSFDWKPSQTGWFLAALGLLVLPAIGLVTYASRRGYEDRHLILYSVVGTLVGCLVMLQWRHHGYSSVQYIVGTVLLFIFPNTMEAPSMSLLSKNIPSSLSRGLFNLGFFTTEAGFSGRVVADLFLTWCGSYGSTEHLVNHVFGFLTLLNAATLLLVYSHMHVLVDPKSKYE